ERLAFELPNALAREVELVSDCLERPRLALEPEAQLEDAPLALGQSVERPPHALAAKRLLGLVERIRGFAVGEQIAQLALIVGAVEPERPLLDQIEERHAESAVALGDRDDEPEVGLDHAALGDGIAALDLLRERDLLGGGEQLVAADVGEEELQ